MNYFVSPEKFKQHSLFKLFSFYYKPNLRLFVLDMVCALLIAIIDLSFPFISRLALQKYLPDANYHQFFIVILCLLVAFIFRALMQFIVNFWGHLMGANMEMQMRQDLFHHMQSLPLSFYDNRRTGHLLSRILNDLFDIAELAHHGPEDIIISIITLIGSSIAMWFIYPPLAIIIMLFLPLQLLFTIFLRKKMSTAARNLKESTAIISSDIESSLSGIRVAQAFANEKYESEKFIKGSLLYRNARKGFYKIMASFLTGMDFMSHFLNLLAIGVGGYFIIQGNMTQIDLIAFTLYIGIFLAPIRKLTNFAELFGSGMAGFSRFAEIMKEESKIVEIANPVDLPQVQGNITFSHVSFAYGEEEENSEIRKENLVLKDINLTVQAGETLAVVGPSGSGKTTLCHLLPRFYEANSGTISIDSIDIKTLRLANLRENIGLVQQDVFLFASSVMENIRYGCLSATDAEVIQAARQAELDDFIMSLPETYQTFVGERGLKLSGGQKQRIAIARVFLKNPPILLLDEATSALDTITEQKIQSALEKLSFNRTTIIIAHRLSTIKKADKIIYLDETGIRESGNHNQLIEQNGFYAKLYNSL